MTPRVYTHRMNCRSTSQQRQQAPTRIRQDISQLRHNVYGIHTEHNIVRMIDTVQQLLHIILNIPPVIDLGLDRLEHVSQESLVHVRPLELGNSKRGRLKWRTVVVLLLIILPARHLFTRFFCGPILRDT